jgi:hypothetical protein
MGLRDQASGRLAAATMADANLAAASIIGAEPTRRAAWWLHAAALSTVGRSEPATVLFAGGAASLEHQVRQAAPWQWRQRAGQWGSAIVRVADGPTRGRSHIFESVGRAWRLLRIGGSRTCTAVAMTRCGCAEGSSSASRAWIEAPLACVTALASMAR